MKYSHILSVKLWSDKLGETTNYGNILNKLISELVSNVYREKIFIDGTEQLISIGWEKIKWNNQDESLYSSDIVTCMPDISDKLINDITKIILDKIYSQITMEKSISDDKIVFSIVKPLTIDE